MIFRSDTCVRAVITSIKGTGERKFAVTYPKGDAGRLRKGDSVTFSLGEGWKEEFEPEVGQEVILQKLREFPKGWRALSVFSCNKKG